MRPTGAVGAEPGQLDAFVELLREHHRLLDREPRRLLQLARDERRRRVALALLGRDRRRRSTSARSRSARIAFDCSSLPTLIVVAALLEQLRFELRRLRPGEPREDVPVLLGHERLDLALAVAHQLQRDRLHAAGAQAAADLVPEQRADLVADQPIEHAARALRRDHLLVDGARVLERLLNGLLGDLVERQAVESSASCPPSSWVRCQPIASPSRSGSVAT